MHPGKNVFFGFALNCSDIFLHTVTVFKFEIVKKLKLMKLNLQKMSNKASINIRSESEKVPVPVRLVYPVLV